MTGDIGGASWEAEMMFDVYKLDEELFKQWRLSYRKINISLAK